MAEFKEVMKQWKRLCNWMDNKYSPDPLCNHCPLYEIVNGGCGAIYEMYHDYDYDKMAEVIMKWAEENPVEYPYMFDVLQDVFNMPKGLSPMNIWEWINTIRIPADIAEKLDIEPEVRRKEND